MLAGDIGWRYAPSLFASWTFVDLVHIVDSVHSGSFLRGEPHITASSEEGDRGHR